MAPMRGERGGSPARGARASLPLPRRLIRQIARHVASSGRSLRRLEVSGRVIDNFDDIEDASDESDLEAPQPAVACGGNAGNLPPADHDDDLTSLSWLQDRNLLRGINLTKGDMEDTKMIGSQVLIKVDKEINFDSSYDKELVDICVKIDSTHYEKFNKEFVETSKFSQDPHLNEMLYNLVEDIELNFQSGNGLKRVNLRDKSPAVEERNLLSEASTSSESNPTVDQSNFKKRRKRLRISHFSKEKSEPAKTPPPVARMPSPPRTPCKTPPSPPAVATHTKPPYSFSCLIFMAIEAAPARALPVKEIYAWIVRHFPYFKHAPQGWKNSVRHNLSLNKCFHKVAAAPGLGKGSLWTVDPQHRASLLQAFGRQPIPPAPPDTPPPAKNAPDPQLFPFLARRLAASPPPPEPGADEYLAAATVLAMKYGPHVLEQLPPAAHLVISRCARDEHSYSGGCEERRTAEALLNLAGLPPAGPS